MRQTKTKNIDESLYACQMSYSIRRVKHTNTLYACILHVKGCSNARGSHHCGGLQRVKCAQPSPMCGEAFSMFQTCNTQVTMELSYHCIKACHLPVFCMHISEKYLLFLTARITHVSHVHLCLACACTEIEMLHFCVSSVCCSSYHMQCTK